ncbi:hypothetical protein DL96DRAFT_635937 [Flagelloscypha sp. PMI_526]|nr:hypothetical protein DL96DRAFT_635937 [Flagelloscypha sp. PMI_526]
MSSQPSSPALSAFSQTLSLLPSLIPTLSSSSPQPSIALSAEFPSPLTPAAEQDIRRACDLASTQEQELIASLPKLSAVMDEVQASIDKHQAFISLHKSLLSSHRRFPPEIWHHIFNFAVAADREPAWQNRTRQPQPHLIPLTLSHVCTEWRKLALQSPCLWCFIYVNIEDSFPDSRMKLLNAFLLRSRNNPLDIIIWVSSNPVAFSYSTVLRFIF